MLLGAICLFVARSRGVGTHQATDARNVYQIGSFGALKEGRYDGTKPIQSLLSHGNMGVGSINVPGYHFHFINSDRNRGGHVTAYRLGKGTIRIMRLEHIVIAK